jgi:peptidoglycan hydrolase-like protein with peptidoglycan-binding domain
MLCGGFPKSKKSFAGSYGYSDYGYGYGNARVIEVQRRLARAGYYHGAIDGIMGPQTRRAIRAYERDHNMPAYGVIDGQRLTTMSLV